MEITIERLLVEINKAIVQKEDFMVRRAEDNDDELVFVVGKYDFVDEDWINPRITSRFTLMDA